MINKLAKTAQKLEVFIASDYEYMLSATDDTWSLNVYVENSTEDSGVQYFYISCTNQITHQSFQLNDPYMYGPVIAYITRVAVRVIAEQKQSMEGLNESLSLQSA